MAKIITTIATKGGTGKTTTIAWLSGLLRAFGYKCLIIDTDPQASCSFLYALAAGSQHGMVELLARGGKSIDESFITKTAIDGIDQILADFPSKEGGAPLVSFAARPDNAYVLRNAVRCPALAAYDFILIDTQGSIGPLQRSAALAADIVLSPFAPSSMDVNELISGTKPMIDDLSSMVDYGLTMPTILTFANNMTNTSIAKSTLQGLRREFSTERDILVLEGVIKTSTHFQRALALRQPVHTLDGKVSLMLHELLWQIFPNLAGKTCDDWVKEVKARPALSSEGGAA